MSDLEDIRRNTLAVYDRHATGWDRRRPRVFFERPWLDRFTALLPEGGRVLDAGCGAGEPIAAHLLGQGFDLTGIDASPNMLALCRSRFPEARWVRKDLRGVELVDTEPPFDGIVSWDASFHLTQDEQRTLLDRFADALGPRGALLLSIGPEAGEVTGVVEGEPVYHASLAPEEYVARLRLRGFNRFDVALEDAACDHHSVLLAARTP